MQENIYSPHYDFYIEKVRREEKFTMRTFHFHKKYEIYYLFEGTRRYLIGNEDYLVNAGSLVLIGPDEIHKTVNVGAQPHSRIVLNFSPTLIPTIIANIPEVNLVGCFTPNIHVLPIPMKDRGMIESIFNRLWLTRNETAPEALALRQVLLSELLLYAGQFVREFQETTKDTAANKPVNPLIDKIQVFISSNFRSELTLATLAKQFFISPTYLSRLFRQETGLGLVEYINSVRMMHAKRLLENTTMRITEISMQSGFATAEHFTRVFKAGTGLSPQQYRKFYQQSKGIC